MKYSDSNKPLVCMQTQSTCYMGTCEMTVKGVLWHSTGANNPTIKRYVQPSDVKPVEDSFTKEEWLNILGVNKYKNDWNHIKHSAGLNCWIGKLADGTITTVQTMPWNYRPWGCGSGKKGSCNSGWIQFEICEDNLTNKDYFEKVYNEACEITAYLCKMFNLDPKGTVEYNGVKAPVILCHQDSYKLGLGSNHGDVLHWFKKHGKTMDDVRNDVAKLIEEKETSVLVSKFKAGDIVTLAEDAVYYNGKAVPAWAKEKAWIVHSVVGDRVVINESEDGKNAINSPINEKFLTLKKIEKPFEPYLVKITASILNYRQGPGTKYKINGTVRKGQIYTIVDEKDGWGKLKSGAGWIKLSYTKKT